jgi:hypothetical protein
MKQFVFRFFSEFDKENKLLLESFLKIWFRNRINFYFHPINLKQLYMKRVCFVLLCLIALNTYGQFAKGTRTVGINITSIGFSSLNSTFDVDQVGSSGTTNNNLNLSVIPSMGWFISENILIGGNLNLNYANSKYTAGNNVTRKGNSVGFGLGGFGRYYFGADGFMPYAQAGIGFGFGSGKNTWDEKYTAYSEKGEGNQTGILNLNAGLGVGLTKLINKNIGLDVGLGYAFTNTSYNYSSESNVQFTNPVSSELKRSKYKYTGTNNGVSVSLGFLIFLDPKK